MVMMGRYCKAYPVERFREFSGWTEHAGISQQGVDGEEAETTASPFLYLQENYVVTDSIFQDERIVYDDITPAWISFCQQELQFEVPFADEEQVRG